MKKYMLLLFALITFLTTTQAGVPRIMYLGDSITENDWEGGYRSFLYKALSDSGYKFAYVGRNTSDHDATNLGFSFPQQYWNHEGYNSRAIYASYLPWLDDIGNAMRANTPDIMTVLIGTNDAANGTRSSIQIRDDLSALLDSVWKYNPGTKIILSNIMQMYSGYANDIINKVNPLLPALVASKKALGKYIVFVDNHSALTLTSDFVDGVHPSVQGYHKMTAVWYPAIVAALKETALPVELTSFTYKYDGAHMQLQWATATEHNNYGFEIERKRSTDGDWNTIGFAPGHGTTNTPHTYSFVDNTLPGTYIYRIKQIDQDGHFEYSKEIRATTDVPTIATLDQNYPNPFNPETNIQYQLVEDGPVSIVIYDELGKEVVTLMDQLERTGKHIIQWNTKNIPSGIYYYRLRAGNFTAVKRMQVIK